MFANPTETDMRTRLEGVRTIAIVGLSDKENTDSFGVGEYLVSAGYTVVPVNPDLQTWEGRQSFPDLATAKRATERVGKTLDLVDVFKRPSAVKPIVDEAMRLKLPALWFELGVIDWDQAARARDHGVWVVMDRCIAVLHRKFFGSPTGH